MNPPHANLQPPLHPMSPSDRPFAIVTGASSGIGYYLAREYAHAGFDLLVAADEPAIASAAEDFRALGVATDLVQTDLATVDGVDRLLAATQGRRVDYLLANAGHGLGRAFLDQDFDECRHVIDTNITGTVYLIQEIGREMRARGEGRILVTGSIAGFMPGAYHAVYNGTKAFIDSFCFAIRHELKDTGVTVTCLMPGATETDFFERADMMDTKVGTQEKDDPADVAKTGFEAMMRGDGDVVSGWQNKLQTAIANITPAGVLAAQHAKEAKPGTAES
jgi:short-subunit dehydrogenase